ncbi:terminase family protein [Neomegalonema sp.]|uniref:terminase large subunit domain-containing protein n=1 Tax=Neomegalonema sp. TaxID=2039713 RepID=UPI0026328269|nr:terminase family protein [Neomegalonema sp.]MDD2867701.1 terminase family protein [Neomegalonema sp.]
MSSPAVPLYPYQRAWLADRSRFKVGMWSRQIGKTFTTTLEAVDDCFEAFTLGARRRWVILSRGERQAKEAMDEGVKLHAKAYQMAFEELEYEVAGAGDARYKALEVVLPGGSRITALPANPDTARGFSANVLLDEFAFHHDSRAIWKALFPVISAGHKIRVVSTPNGKGNKFHELVTAEGDAWSRHIVDIHRAVAEGLPRDIEELRAGIADEDAWAQEYELKWLDEASAWLPHDLILGAEHEAAGDPEGRQGGACFIGNDIARRNDLWVAWVWEQVGDVFWTREIVELKGASFSEQDDRLHDLMQRYDPVRLVMDQTGMGEKPVEDAQRRYGELRVEGVLMTPARQLDLATHAKQIFEDRKARIPAGDPVLRADLHKIKKMVGPSGRPRLVANRDSAGHADRTWAAFMGLAGAAEGAVAYGYRAARREDSDAEDRAGVARFTKRGAW